MCAAQSLRKAKSRLPLWGRWTRVSEDGEGEVSAAPSHGLCRSAGGLPSQSPSGDSVSAAASVGRWATSHRDVAAPRGGAKSRLPLWGRCPRRGRRGQPAPGAHVRYSLDEHERSELPKARIDSGGTPPFGKGASLFP